MVLEQKGNQSKAVQTSNPKIHHARALLYSHSMEDGAVTRTGNHPGGLSRICAFVHLCVEHVPGQKRLPSRVAGAPFGGFLLPSTLRRADHDPA